MFFDLDDYATFNVENMKLNTAVIRSKREDVQKKLLDLHKDIITDYTWNQYGLYAHKDKSHITSEIHPNMTNQYTVGWLGLRYGRSSTEIDLLNDFKLKQYKTAEDKSYGFQKYNNFEICIYPNALVMGLYHSTRYDGVDRMYVNEQIRKQNDIFLKQLDDILFSLKGYGLCFSSDFINETGEWERKIFYFDSYYKTGILENFLNFYKLYGQEGCVNLIMRDYPIKDTRIQTKESIISEFFSIIDILLPLYNLFSWKPKTNLY